MDTAGAAKTFTFDANGNMTSDGTRTFEWDARNQLVAALVGTSRSELSYDGRQHRVGVVEKESGLTQSDTSIWCADVMCQERAAGGATTRLRFALGEQVGGVARFFANDHLGSVIDITDAMGSVVARHEFDPSGRRTRITGTGPATIGFTGHVENSTAKLWLATHRAYDPALGRWLNEDPLGFVDGPNMYSYVANRIVTTADPSGLSVRIRCEIIRGYGWPRDFAVRVFNAALLPGGRVSRQVSCHP